MRALFIIAAAAFAACGTQEKEIPEATSGMPGSIYVTTVGGCQYVVWEDYYPYAAAGGITHAGDCPNPIHRNDSTTQHPPAQ